MSFYFALLTVENNKNKKSVKFQGDLLNYCGFIQVFVFTKNHHLKSRFLLEGIVLQESKQEAPKVVPLYKTWRSTHTSKANQ